MWCGSAPKGMVLLWLSVLLASGLCGEHGCRVKDGTDGHVGAPGRDGRPGQKGQKGESVVLQGNTVVVRGSKGEQGERGTPGPMGPKGFRGELGDQGLPGLPGLKGPKGDGSKPSGEYRSAFSALRTLKQHPKLDQAVVFNKVLTNVNQDYDPSTGRFRSKIQGVYYFMFHAVSSGDLCLAFKNIHLDQEEVGGLAFCDYNSWGQDQVLSGGTVLQLKKGEEVWLEAVQEQGKSFNKMSISSPSIFSGFLIFPVDEEQA
ncbi:C1QA protein, partial [Amia calva]|nr:C1QA protein [Amia calva]